MKKIPEPIIIEDSLVKLLISFDKGTVKFDFVCMRLCNLQHRYPASSSFEVLGISFPDFFSFYSGFFYLLIVLAAKKLRKTAVNHQQQQQQYR